MVDILHRIGIRATPDAVTHALSTADGVAGWWSATTTGDGGLGGRLSVPFDDPTHPYVIEVVDLDPGATVRWRVVDGPPEWVGTHVEFRLSRPDDRTVVLFRHQGWAEPVEFMHHCSTKWATYLLSLREHLETGSGRPRPHDLKIDDWG